MKEYPRKKIIDRMFEAALKEKFSELARKYDPGLLFEIWTQLLKGGGVQGRFPEKEWDQKMTIEQALDCLDDYCTSIESLIRKPKGEDKAKKKKGD